MAAIAPIANIAGIISLADIAYAFAKDISKLCSRVGQAQEEIKRLDRHLNQLRRTIEHVKKLTEKYKISELHTENDLACATLDELIEYGIDAIRALHRQAEDHAQSLRDSWIGSALKSCKWASKPDVIDGACVELKRFQSGLQTTLQLCANEVGLSTYTTSLKLQSDFNSLFTEFETKFDDFRHLSTSQQEKLCGLIMQASQKQNHLKPEQSITLRSNIQDETPLDGINPEAIILPLLQIKEPLLDSISDLVAEDKISIPKSAEMRLKAELEWLLSVAHRSSSDAALKRTSLTLSNARQMTSSNTVVSRRRTSEGEDKAAQLAMQIPLYTADHRWSSRTIRYSKVRRSCFCRSIHSGTLFVYYEGIDGDHNNKSLQEVNFKIGFTFVPAIAHGSIGIDALFVMHTLTAPEPQIERVIRVFNTVSDKSILYELINENDLEGVRKLFDKRKASPFDYGSGGSALFYSLEQVWKQGPNYPFKTKRTDICKLLLWHGADYNEVDRQGHSMCHWLADWLFEYEMDDLKELLDTYDSRCDDDEKSMRPWYKVGQRIRSGESPRKILDDLLASGHRLDQSNLYCFNPFLLACTEEYPAEWLQLLIDEGTNTSYWSYGYEAIEILVNIATERGADPWDGFGLDSFRAKLDIIFKTGADPNLILPLSISLEKFKFRDLHRYELEVFPEILESIERADFELYWDGKNRETMKAFRSMDVRPEGLVRFEAKYECLWPDSDDDFEG